MPPVRSVQSPYCAGCLRVIRWRQFASFARSESHRGWCVHRICWLPSSINYIKWDKESCINLRNAGSYQPDIVLAARGGLHSAFPSESSWQPARGKDCWYSFGRSLCSRSWNWARRDSRDRYSGIGLVDYLHRRRCRQISVFSRIGLCQGVEGCYLIL